MGRSCLRQLQISIHFELKSRQNILRLPQKHWKVCFHFQHPIFVTQGFLTKTRSWSRLDISNTLSGVSVSHHRQIGSSSCRGTSSGLPLILRYGKLYNYFIICNNRNKVHNKCYVFKSSWNHPWLSLWKNCLPQNWCQKDWALLF